jgi:hypothetical protein
VVVEAQFREHFQLAHATPAFAQLLAAAPAELVATRARLAQLVQLLSGAVAEAFAAQGLPLPPWRKPKSVLSKWGLLPPAEGAHAPDTAAACTPDFSPRYDATGLTRSVRQPTSLCSLPCWQQTG